VLRLPTVMSMVAPLLLLGCSVFPANPSNPFIAHRERLGLATAPVPPLPVYGQRLVVPIHQPAYDVSGSALVSRDAALEARSLSALHPTLPVPSLVEITNLENECSILVRVVGRSVAAYDRLIEISPSVAKLLRIRSRGDVRVTYHAPAPLDGNDGAERLHLARYPALGCTR
jgi:hypothetical protein